MDCVDEVKDGSCGPSGCIGVQLNMARMIILTFLFSLVGFGTDVAPRNEARENGARPAQTSLYAADPSVMKVHESVREKKSSKSVDQSGSECPPDLESVLEAQEAQKAKEEAEAKKLASQNTPNVWNPRDGGSVGSGFSRYSGDDEYDAPAPVPQVSGPARKPSPARGPARATSGGGGGFRLGG